MNSCGQHGLAHIGFHGSSMKAAGKVLPANQVLLGGGSFGDGVGRAGEKIVKVPAKRTTDVLRVVLNSYQENALPGEVFNSFYDRMGKDYFYQLIKPLADLTSLTDDDFRDWGHQETYVTAIGVGECAGVIIDLVATLLFESEEKLGWARETFVEQRYADSIYHSYSVLISAAKALLLDKGVNSSTQIGVIRDFSTHYGTEFDFGSFGAFEDFVLQINKNEPSIEFASAYLEQAGDFLNQVKMKRESLIQVG